MLGRRLRVIAPLLVFIGVTIVAAVVAPPARAAMPIIDLTLSASTTKAAANTVVTFTGTATARNATFLTARVSLEVAALSCEPTPECTLLGSQVQWDFTQFSGTKAFSATATGLVDRIARLFVVHCDPDCAAGYAEIYFPGPSYSASLTYSPAGVIQPGSTLRFTVTGSTDVGPVPADLQSKIIDGLSDPTVIPEGGRWSAAPYRYLDYHTTLDKKASYSFDAIVTGAIGDSVKVTIFIYPDNIRDGGLKKTFSFPIGAEAHTPTPPPKPPKATPTPKPPPTPRPNPTRSPTAETAMPTALNGAPSDSTVASGEPTSSPSQTPLPSHTMPPAAGASTGPAPSPSPRLVNEVATPDGGSVAFLGLGVIVIVIGAAAVVVGAWRGFVIRRPPSGR